MHYRELNPTSTLKQVIVLIHGNFSSIKWWDDVVDELKPRGNRIIVMDLRGFGKSSYNQKCYRFNDWACDVIQLLKMLKVEKAILNGWSFGGAISQKVAELAPALVEKLILTCSVSHEGFSSKNSEGKPLKTQQEICQLPKVAYSLDILKNRN